ncbi:DinB family protein [Spongiimicrobium salis]|uniref:DinB family protein n=1 Tax=Spongiimicrobium salis TaxID=1667022 RepID=UPI00374DDAD8
MKVFLNQLFDYNFYCNKKLIEECGKVKDKLPQKSKALFSHILNAHHLWNARLLGSTSKYEAFQLHDFSLWEDLHYENQRSSFEVITQTEDFEKRVDYQNDKGRLFITSVKDILFHIINHSTHHRGQISTNFRDNGLEPFPMDYIEYKR